MAKWQKQSLELASDHAWRTKPGYQIVVLDRGAVRFDVPKDWVIGPGEGAIELRDRPHPDDNCLLQVSVLRLPVGVDGSHLPLVQLLEEATRDIGQDAVALGATRHTARPGVTLVWREMRYEDPGERREARSYTCLALGAGVQAFISMAFWPEDAECFSPVWNEVLRSLRLGEVLEPTTGRRRR